MKTGLLSALALASSLTTVGALSLHRRQDGNPRVVHFDVAKRKIADPVAHDRRRLRRRDNTLNLGLTNDVSGTTRKALA